jgi:hypothetical protein
MITGSAFQPAVRRYDTDVREFEIPRAKRRALLLMASAALAVPLAPAQERPPRPGRPEEEDENPRLPNGKTQRNEILKADYQRNVKESRELADMAKQFADDLEKNDRFVLSVASLKQLDEIERLARRIRGRMKGS